jgi:hypothetical protein
MFNRGFLDGQAEASPATRTIIRRLDLEKLLKNSLAKPWCYSGALIGDKDNDVAVVTLARGIDSTIQGRKLDRVL